jgi:hypothetical protein
MLKARSSFPSVIYNNDYSTDKTVHSDKVTDIMARYYKRIDEIFQADALKQRVPDEGEAGNSSEGEGHPDTINSPASSGLTDTALPDTQKYLNVIEKSKRKLNKISTSFSLLDEDMKKLEDDGHLLSTVRENLDNLGRNFWEYLNVNKPVSTDPAVT